MPIRTYATLGKPRQVPLRLLVSAVIVPLVLSGFSSPVKASVDPCSDPIEAYRAGPEVCPCPDARDVIWADPSMWRVPYAPSAIYLPEIEWERRPAFDNNYPAVSTTDECRTAKRFMAWIPKIKKEGAGAGYLVLDGDVFGCSDETVCEFSWAGRKYNLRSSQVIKKHACVTLPEVRNMPRTAQYFPGNDWPRFTGIEGKFIWAKQDSLCFPVPRKPGKYSMSFRAYKPATQKVASTKRYVCRFSPIANGYKCGWETSQNKLMCVFSNNCDKVLGRNYRYQRTVLVTPNFVDVRKR